MTRGLSLAQLSLKQAPKPTFRKTGIDLVLLDVPVDQEEAVRLYRKAGFEVRAHNMKKHLD